MIPDWITRRRGKPRLSAEAGEDVPLPARAPVFVFGMGRSGTTLVQRLLNTHDEMVIWGEHAGVLAPLAESWHQFRTKKQLIDNVYRRWDVSIEEIDRRLRQDFEGQEYVNAFDEAVAMDAFRAMVVRLFTHGLDPARVSWGFKEIQYGQGDHVPEMLAYLFPAARFVVVVRHPVAVTASRLVAWSPDRCERAVAGDQEALTSLTETIGNGFAKWERINTFFRDFTARAPGTRIMIPYEALVEDPEKEATNLFGFLGLEPPGTWRKVLSRNKGTTTRVPYHKDIKDLVRQAFAGHPLATSALTKAFGYSASA